MARDIEETKSSFQADSTAEAGTRIFRRGGSDLRRRRWWMCRGINMSRVILLTMGDGRLN
jgi:hypothetical protein